MFIKHPPVYLPIFPPFGIHQEYLCFIHAGEIITASFLLKYRNHLVNCIPSIVLSKTSQFNIDHNLDLYMLG